MRSVCTSMTRLGLLYWLTLSVVTHGKPPPRLTVFIVVDAFGSDLMLRNRSSFQGGLKRLSNEGAVFPVMRYEVAKCVTGVGHATLMTGAWPNSHGIIGNKIFNRATNQLEPIFIDLKHPVLTAPLQPNDASPANLLAETLADRLRVSTDFKGKALAISGKGRAAIAMAGRLGEAWWFHKRLGRFVTGSWYRKEFPDWVKAFNAKKLPDSFHTKKWKLLRPRKYYRGRDERHFETDSYGLGITFPHTLSGNAPSPSPQSYAALAMTPMVYDVLVPFIKAAIDGEGLGKDDVPDLLMLSFSAVDYTYHLYGPNSWEMQDHLLRFDSVLDEILTYAEQAAGGKANLVVTLTGDHGGASIPEEWAAQGFNAARISNARLLKGLNTTLKNHFEVQHTVAAIDGVDVYLNHKTIKAEKLNLAFVSKTAAAWLKKQPGVYEAISADDLVSKTGHRVWTALQHGYHPLRSGDVLMVVKPMHVQRDEPSGTTHGTPWNYDAQVPWYIFGRGVRPGEYGTIPLAIDVTPTIASLMQLSTPAMSEGRPMTPALETLQ